MREKISKIALFGGSFDPPHTGHDKIVNSVLNSLDIDLLIIMPAFINPFKDKFSAPANLRLKWAEILWGNLDRVLVLDYETSQNRAVYTIESVKFLRSKYKNLENLYLIIGADNLENLHKWKSYEELKNLVQFVVASRDEIKIPNNLKKININDNISSSFIRANLDENHIPNSIRDSVIKFYQGKKMRENIEKIAEILNEKKAENVEIVDMGERDYIAKFVIIATILTGRHGASLIDDIKEKSRELGEKILAVESSEDWTVIDMGDIIVHLLSQTYRERYNIEEFLEKLKRETHE